MGKNTQNGLININLQPLADVTNNIINKFADAVGWLAIPRGARKDMETATEVYIEGIKNDSSLLPLVKAQKISQARKEIKEYCNMQDILEHAVQFGRAYDDSNAEPMDEDWAMFFYDRAKNISREDAKILWGKLLSEECRQEGTIPKSLIHILSIMSKHDAEIFETICGFIPDNLEGSSIVIGQDPLIVGDATNELLQKHKLTYEALHDLEALGLLYHNVIDIRTIFEGDVSQMVVGYSYHGTVIEVRKFHNEFPRGHVVLTQDGRVLASMIERKRIAGFENYLKAYYEEKGCHVMIKN